MSPSPEAGDCQSPIFLRAGWSCRMGLGLARFFLFIFQLHWWADRAAATSDSMRLLFDRCIAF